MSTPTSFAELVNSFIGIINILVVTAMAVIFVFVVWKIIDSWILNAGDEKKHESGKQTALVAIIVLVIVTIIWGIVNMLRASLFG